MNFIELNQVGINLPNRWVALLPIHLCLQIELLSELGGGPSYYPLRRHVENYNLLK